MRLSEIMSDDVQTIDPDEDAAAAFERMSKQRIRHLVVMEQGRMVGILSSRDLPGGNDPIRAKQSVRELMTGSVASAAPATTLRQAANLLRGKSISCLPVLEGDRLVGIVTTTDLLEALGKGSQERASSASSRWKPVRRAARWPHVTRRNRGT